MNTLSSQSLEVQDFETMCSVLHVYPLFGRTHDTGGEEMCWCYPVVEVQASGSVLIIHSACH